MLKFEFHNDRGGGTRLVKSASSFLVNHKTTTPVTAPALFGFSGEPCSDTPLVTGILMTLGCWLSRLMKERLGVCQSIPLQGQTCGALIMHIRLSFLFERYSVLYLYRHP